MRIFTSKSIVWTTALLVAAPAMAQSLDQHRANCEDSGQPTPAVRIASCTALIESGQETSANLLINFFNRGSAYFYLKDYGRAIANYSQGIRINPQNADAFYTRGNTYFIQEDYARAISDYSQAIRINPQYARAFNARGDSYAQQRDYARAISDYSQAIKINPQDRDVFFNRADVYTKLKDYGRAISDFDEVIRLNPQSVRAFYNRGITKRSLGKTAEGDADIARARAMTPRRRP